MLTTQYESYTDLHYLQPSMFETRTKLSGKSRFIWAPLKLKELGGGWVVVCGWPFPSAAAGKCDLNGNLHNLALFRPVADSPPPVLSTGAPSPYLGVWLLMQNELPMPILRPLLFIYHWRRVANDRRYSLPSGYPPTSLLLPGLVAALYCAGGHGGHASQCLHTFPPVCDCSIASNLKTCQRNSAKVIILRECRWFCYC